jgi:hypothetical protein
MDSSIRLKIQAPHPSAAHNDDRLVKLCLGQLLRVTSTCTTCCRNSSDGVHMCARRLALMTAHSRLSTDVPALLKISSWTRRPVGTSQRASRGPQRAPFRDVLGIAYERLHLPCPGKSELPLPRRTIVQNGLVFFCADSTNWPFFKGSLKMCQARDAIASEKAHKESRIPADVINI